MMLTFGSSPSLVFFKFAINNCGSIIREPSGKSVTELSTVLALSCQLSEHAIPPPPTLLH